MSMLRKEIKATIEVSINTANKRLAIFEGNNLLMLVHLTRTNIHESKTMFIINGYGLDKYLFSIEQQIFLRKVD